MGMVVGISARERLHQSSMMSKDVQKLENWLRERDYYLCLDRSLDWEVFPARKVVRGDPYIFKYEKSMIAVLLHECGHVEQFLENKMFTIPKLKKGEKAKKSFYISVLEAEIDAWNRGERIAKELGIKNLGAAFKRTKFWRLMSYVDWASKRGDISFLKEEKLQEKYP
jgi:hypothetical protein